MRNTLKKIVSIALSIILILSFSISALASEHVNSNEAQVSLEDVFNEAMFNYPTSAALHSVSSSSQSVFTDRQVLPDGTILTVVGYPTTYSNDPTPLEDGQHAENYIYALSSSPLTYEDDTTETWGYLYSRIKYYNRTATKGGISYTQKRIDSFSYELEPKSGYSLSTMNIRYYSTDSIFYEGNVTKTITTSQLVMTNYPTTSLGWVCSEVPILGGHETGVEYRPVLNGRSYSFAHLLVSTGL